MCLGQHIIAEFHGCSAKILNDEKVIKEMLTKAAIDSGATVCGEAFHKFCPQGITAVVILAESHISIHTWPEKGCAAFDMFTCGDHVSPWVGYYHVKDVLQAIQAKVQLIVRE